MVCSATHQTSGQLDPKLPRELTHGERAEIRKLVKAECANYDRDNGCLPLDCDCVMLHKCWTGGGCRYFRNSVLPLDPILEDTLTGGGKVETRPCAVCGEVFPVKMKKAYCSDACARKAQRRQQKEYMRKKRDGC